MNRTTSITLIAILAVAMVAVPIATAGVVSSGTVQGDPAADGGTESIKPGEQFSAAIGVQNAEIKGDVSERAFGVRIATAETNETKAAIVDEQFMASQTRLAALEARLERLNESHEAGDISEGRYRAEVATTVAELRTVERQVAAVETTAAELPPEALDERGVDVDSIRSLRDRAGELGGSDTASVARSIAGNDVGQPIGDSREARGPPEQDSNERTDGQNGTTGPPSED
ncbi:hypothetical protein E2L06_19135 [Haloterrigena sp. H1]|uniref:DUF7096 domain-containing protein n=1 Tax=Haloterrigena sp. H1 TaxID=2552943 RepID=UPI00110E3D0F|nr:hypothetical protein [Haloterrigena sp. H1]TMT80352.1 hypothetical protein E2L06_19135 [Haloterrigena sp. H1]